MKIFLKQQQALALANNHLIHQADRVLLESTLLQAVIEDEDVSEATGTGFGKRSCLSQSRWCFFEINIATSSCWKCGHF